MTRRDFENELSAFVAEWQNSESSLLVHTSGSTGAPKPFWASKEKMANSAQLTCSFLNLKAGDTALLCMPLQYIGGKMVVVRALVSGMELVAVAPSGNPLRGVDRELTFAAMTPMQVFNSLREASECERLKSIEHLIIGGGSIDSDLAATLRTFPNNVWSTYGMTETLSHIAMRRLSGAGASEWYTPMDGVRLSLGDESTLRITAPLVCDETLQTNDIAEINERGEFKIVGRRDNIINSGGVKIQIEEAERLLSPHLGKPFVITSMRDAKFGEAVVLITEETDVDAVRDICRKALPKLWMPKRIVVQKVELTETGKAKRRLFTCSVEN